MTTVRIAHAGPHFDGHAKRILIVLADDPGHRAMGLWLPPATAWAAFGAVFTAIGVRTIKAPVRAPRANAIAERWIAGPERHLRQVLADYEHHARHP